MPKDKQQLEQLMELQNRAAELQRHIAQLTATVNGTARQRSVLNASIEYMKGLPVHTKTYKPVGKTFVRMDKAQLKEEMTDVIDRSLVDEESRKNLRDQFLVKLRECEAQIDELAEQFNKSSSGVKS